MSGPRLRADHLDGYIEDDPLTDSATTLTSAALAAVPALVDGDGYYPVTLDPDGTGPPERVWITAHTAAATTATISRGEEGTTARAHNEDIRWVHGPTAADFASDWALIEEIELTSDATNIEFSSIPNYWRDLVIRGEVRSDDATATTDHPLLRVGNGTVDSGASSYSWAVWQHYETDNVVDQEGSNAASSIRAGYNSIPTAGNTSGDFGRWSCEILRYADTSNRRLLGGESRYRASAAGVHRWVPFEGVWEDTTDEIDVVRVLPANGSNFVTGSYLTLYGRGERRNP